MSDAAPLHQFTSHVAGRNAKVWIFSDRIEWEKPRSRSMTATIATGGLNYLAKRGIDTEMIPVKNVSSVTSKRDGMLNTIVSVITSGNTVDFRVSHAEAKQVREVLNQLILGGGSALAPTAGPVGGGEDVASQIRRFAELHQQGILTDEEFAAKKAQLLG